MISFKQFLAELFDKPYPYKKDPMISTQHANGYKFDTGNGIYGALVEVTLQFNAKLNKQVWTAELSFGRERDGIGYELAPIGSDAKDVSRIYATIAYILRQTIKTDSRIRVIYFTAAHKRTVPLYQRFAKQIAKELGGNYEFRNPDAFMVYL